MDELAAAVKAWESWWAENLVSGKFYTAKELGDAMRDAFEKRIKELEERIDPKCKICGFRKVDHPKSIDHAFDPTGWANIEECILELLYADYGCDEVAEDTTEKIMKLLRRPE